MEFELNGEDADLGNHSSTRAKMFIEDDEEFRGFDGVSLDNIESGRRILQKLIAETESLKGTAPKRQKSTRALWKNLKNADSLIEEADDSTTNLMNSDLVDDLTAVLESSTETSALMEDTFKSEESENNSIPVSTSAKKTRKNRSSAVMNTSATPAPSTPTPTTTAGSDPGRPKGSVDITNPAYREPFNFGWKREMVFRGTNAENQGKRMADIYYYTPEGKKVRSYREVVKFLSNTKLTIDNFTFFKEPLGVNDPNIEIIREAKKPKDSFGTPTVKAPVTPKVVQKPTPKPAKAVSKPTPKPAAKPAANKSLNKSTPAKTANKSLNASNDLPPEPASFTSIEASPPKKKAQKETVKNTRKSDKIKTILPFNKAAKEQEARNSFMVSICAGYQALSQVFQYLKVHELLRAARVCRMWRDLAAHPSLWKSVVMKNSQVTDWDAFAETLKMRGTQHLDLRKMLIVSKNTDEVWAKFVSVMPRITSLTKLELCKCPASVVQDIMKNCPQLQGLNALSIQCDSLNLEPVSNMTGCQELRLKSIGVTINNMTLHGDLTPLLKLTDLTHLSLTSVKDLGKKHVDVLKSLTKLQSLELGECSDFADKFGTTVLMKLKNLERLRLEKGQDSCNIFDILKGISKLENLSQLELVNFDVKHGFDKNLANCKNLKRLLIIPTYVSQSATTNNMLIGGVAELSDSLTHFVWGVTQELLKVTELFRDQNAQSGRQITGDSIPVLKPVPYFNLIEDIVKDKGSDKEEKKSNTGNPQVEILPLSHLQKLLLNVLPKTRVKILKIPFHATWRQNISGSTAQK